MTPKGNREAPKLDVEPPEPEPEPEPGEGGGDQPAPKPEPEPEGAEAQARKLDNAHRKYLKDLTGIVGAADMATMEDCPYCGGFSVVPSEMALRHREDTEPCTTCQGLGRMVTGSKVAEHAILPCPKCSGSGYQHKQPPRPENVVPITSPAQPQPVQVHGWFDAATQTFHPYGEEVAPS